MIFNADRTYVNKSFTIAKCFYEKITEIRARITFFLRAEKSLKNCWNIVCPTICPLQYNKHYSGRESNRWIQLNACDKIDLQLLYIIRLITFQNEFISWLWLYHQYYLELYFCDSWNKTGLSSYLSFWSCTHMHWTTWYKAGQQLGKTIAYKYIIPMVIQQTGPGLRIFMNCTTTGTSAINNTHSDAECTMLAYILHKTGGIIVHNNNLVSKHFWKSFAQHPHITFLLHHTPAA